jgi:hypothetical protein
MPVLDTGKVKPIAVDGAADDITIELQPADGFEYEVVDLWGYHDDGGGNQTLSWALTNGVTTVSHTGASKAASDNHHFPLYGSTNVMLASPLYIDHQNYLQLSAGALGAGKKLFIRGIVYERAQR